jgi:hypothetical protein
MAHIAPATALQIRKIRESLPPEAFLPARRQSGNGLLDDDYFAFRRLRGRSFRSFRIFR